MEDTNSCNFYTKRALLSQPSMLVVTFRIIRIYQSIL